MEPMPQNGLFSLDGEVAVVIGGGGVLAGAMAEGLAQAGASIAIAGRTLEKAEARAQSIAAQRHAAAGFQCDASKRSDVERLRDAVLERFGRVDILINAAGENGGKPDQVAEFTLQLASRAAQQQQNQETGSATNTLAGALGRGTQSLSVTGDTGSADAIAGTANSGAQMPTLAGLGGADTAASDSVAVSGQMGQTNGLANFNEDDIRQRVQEAVERAQRQGGAMGDVANAVVGMLGGMMGPGGFGGGPGGFGGQGGFGGGRQGGMAGGGRFATGMVSAVNPASKSITVTSPFAGIFAQRLTRLKMWITSSRRVSTVES